MAAVASAPRIERSLAGLGEPVKRTTAEQIDRAQLVEGPDALEGEVVLLSNRKGSGERVRGRGEVTLAFPLAKHLERFAGQLVAAAGLRRGQRRTSQRDRHFEVAFAEGHLGGKDLGVTDSATGCRESPGVIELIPRTRPIGGHDGRPS